MDVLQSPEIHRVISKEVEFYWKIGSVAFYDNVYWNCTGAIASNIFKSDGFVFNFNLFFQKIHRRSSVVGVSPCPEKERGEKGKGWQVRQRLAYLCDKRNATTHKPTSLFEI